MSLMSQIERDYEIKILQAKAIRDVYRLQSKEHGLLCLKAYDVPLGVVEFIAEAQHHVANRGFPYAPKTLATRRHTYAIHTGGLSYMLTNWVDGRSPVFRDHLQLKKSIRTLARFHTHAEHFERRFAPSVRVRYFHLESRFQSVRNTLKEKCKGDTAIALGALCDASLQQLAKPAVERAIKREDNVCAFVHGDYNYPNLVVDAHGHHQMIDFDNCALHVRMEDLAHIMHRNRPWDVEGMLRLIETYDRVRPIRQDDLKLLVALLYEPYPAIRAIRRKKRGVSRIIPRPSVLRHFANQLRQLS